MDETDVDSLNPFEYQNLLYSQLLGEDVSLYISLEYEISDISEGGQTYTLYLPEGNYAVYGNLPWQLLSSMKAVLYVNDSYETAYARWLSPSVFYIPTDAGDSTASVVMEYEANMIADEQFYALNLDTLAEVTEKISQREADISLIENGYARFEVTAESGESLYISIPYNEGWIITLNGEEAEPELFADCMISIPLEDGVNVIEMKYQVHGLRAGVGISAAMIVLLGILVFVDKRRRQTQDIKINQEN